MLAPVLCTDPTSYDIIIRHFRWGLDPLAYFIFESKKGCWEFIGIYDVDTK